MEFGCFLAVPQEAEAHYMHPGVAHDKVPWGFAFRGRLEFLSVAGKLKYVSAQQSSHSRLAFCSTAPWQSFAV